MDKELRRLKELDREIQIFTHVAAVLNWDQETYMPEAAVDERSDQAAAIQAIIHEKRTAPEMGDLLAKLGADEDNPKGDAALSDMDRALIRVIYRDFSREIKLPKELVVRLAKVTSVGQSRWVEARRKSDFPGFVPVLGEIVDLVIESAERLGYPEHPYDALLDGYEPWMRTARVRTVFEQLQRDLVPLVTAIKDSPQVPDEFLYADFPIAQQDQFGRSVLEKMQWDFTRGRLDVSAHPFTSTLGARDVRLTTRYDANNFKGGVFGTIHEAGHGLYELGFPQEVNGSSLSNAASLGVHESQSRTWENIIGRSRPFWTFFYPRLREINPQQLAGQDLESFYRAINKVEPSHIRVEADEVTYSLHVILRFNLETRLVNREIAVKDLAEAWREESRKLLGIVPASDALGVLQDIHWSLGLIGYFPTYALGNLYGAQFTATMRKELPDLDERLEAGDLASVLDWLRRNIHRHGSSLTAEELVRTVTGEDLRADYFVHYLKEKYRGIYNLTGI